MLNSTSKEAIKVGLSIVIAITLALFFQWEKPYWAAIAVAVMAVNETFAHSINKAFNRLIGTLLGVIYAFFMITLLSQERVLFISFMTLILALSIFMSSDPERGYIFKMGFIVCSIIVCMGGFDGEMSFHFAVLRLQETLLGIITFSVVFRLLWPVDTEKGFISLFIESKGNLIKAIKTPSARDAMLQSNQRNIEKLKQLLSMPLTGSFRLREYKRHWKARVDELLTIQIQVTQDNEQCEADWDAVATQLTNYDTQQPQQPLLKSIKGINSTIAKRTWDQDKRTFIEHCHEDYKKVMQGVSMFITCLIIWIYLPVPSGFIFPMLAGVFAAQVDILTKSAIKNMVYALLGIGSIILIEYIFIMPNLTEIWQLGLFYFVNTLFIWHTFNTPNLYMYRMLGVNLLVVLTSSALNLTPYYSIETPLLMITNMLIIMMIAKIFIDIFDNSINKTQ